MYYVKDQHSIGKFNGVNKIAAEIFADTAEDLPEYNNCKGVDGELSLGTIAITANGEIFLCNSQGSWHNIDDQDLNSDLSNLNGLSLSKQTGRLGDTVGLASTSAIPDEIPDEEVQNDEPEGHTESE